ncbi:uncharacterized protein LOC107274634 isoform X3 [Cephus cinctus]|uniref:Uncharacterized protein LOC107274634 isoform X3 n=1 Tax=Cephus cinctus TaxID=211228 RepID=A0AAJ7RQ17_CEPCN|nr:uncharacterized protein LOC107274634 isoform X3 [Cephus cinctus]
MNNVERVKAALQESSLTVKKITLSYVERLLPEIQGCDTIILFKHAAPENLVLQNDSEGYNDSFVHEKLDLTGSPLQCSFSDECQFNSSVIIPKRQWRKEEEEILPISRMQACVSVNECIENLDKCWAIPILSICDGQDKEKTVLLGIYNQSKWFVTIIARIAELQGLKKVINGIPILMQEHVKLSGVYEHQINVSVLSVFELFGSKAETMDWIEFPKSSFAGCLYLEARSTNLSFYTSSRISSCNLIMEIAAGTIMNDLWKEIILLSQYLSILDTYEQKITNLHQNTVPIKFPQDFTTSFCKPCEEIMRKIHGLLNGDSTLPECGDDIDMPASYSHCAENVTGKYILQKILINVYFRENTDFVDALWRILIVGFNKLYSNRKNHIFIEATKIIATAIDRKKLLSLAQIHLCLEFSLFAQTHLQMPTTNLQPLLSNAYRQYCCEGSPMQLLSDASETAIHQLIVNCPDDVARQIEKIPPSTWRLTLSSETFMNRYSTVTYYSRKPIFPPNIYCPDNIHEDKGEITYHSTVVTCLSHRNP